MKKYWPDYSKMKNEKTYRMTSSMQVIDFGEPIQVWFHTGKNGHKGTPYGIKIDRKVMERMAIRERNKALKELI